jgi:hypothetical protein
MKAGDLCRLFHREREGFMNIRYNDLNLRVNSDQNNLATDKLFDEFLLQPDPMDIFYIHLKLSDVIKKSKVTHSGQNIFKLELEKQNDGGVIKWSRAVRFKHMSSALYLGARLVADPYNEGEFDLKLCLIENYKDPFTLFHLQPMASDTVKSYVTFNSHTRLRHLETGKFIGVREAMREEKLR